MYMILKSPIKYKKEKNKKGQGDGRLRSVNTSVFRRGKLQATRAWPLLMRHQAAF